MSGAGLVFLHLEQGRGLHFLGLPGAGGWVNCMQYVAHLKVFCGGSWEQLMSGIQDTKGPVCRPPFPPLGLLPPLWPQQPSFLTPGYRRQKILNQSDLTGSTGSGFRSRGLDGADCALAFKTRVHNSPSE